ncbi:MAG: DUF1284 domain-containing protein [Bacillota bacterium]|nr:DUF1284 domain-containing protein [Bacillota bacterium]MDW7683279.1 DUF1284 domain-containing protein [Bacillota bacterium]
MINVRGHHLLCLPRFQGRGYSPAFIGNITALADRLAENPDQAVCLVDGPDDICLQCPHQADGECGLVDADVRERDRRILQLLEVVPGECRSYSELQRKLKSVFLHFSLEQICGDCRWLDTCRCLTEPQIP